MPKITIQSLFIVFGVVYLGYHIYTLPLIPVPWFDETYMADIGYNFWQTGKFTRDIVYDAHLQQEELIYGPVYFSICAAVFELFGFGIMQYRSIAFISGLITLGLTLYLFLKYLNPIQTKAWGYALTVLMALDPFFQRCLHEGRMDFTALVFILCGGVSFMHLLEKKKLRYALLMGISLGLALLTTPRVLFFFVGFAPALLFLLTKNAFLRKGLMIAAIIITLLYIPWVLYAYGSLPDWYSYYQERLGYTRIENPGFYIPKQSMPLIGLTAIAIGLAIYRQGISWLAHPLYAIAIGCILSFYLLVTDAGPYSVFILPFYYWLFIGSLSKVISMPSLNGKTN